MQMSDPDILALLGCDNNKVSPLGSGQSHLHPSLVAMPLQPQPSQMSHMPGLFPITPAASPLFNSISPPPSKHSDSSNQWRLAPSLFPVRNEHMRSHIPIKSKSETESPFLSSSSPLLMHGDPSSSSLVSSPEVSSKKPRRRRCFKDLTRDVKCLHENCGRVYATESSLQTHIRLKHNNIGPDGKPQPERVKRKPAQQKDGDSTSEADTKAAPDIRRMRTQSMPVTKARQVPTQSKSTSKAKRTTSTNDVNPKPQQLHFLGALNFDKNDVLGPTVDAPLRSASEPLWGMHDHSNLISGVDFDASFFDLDDVMETVLDFSSLDSTDLSQMQHDSETCLIFAM